MTELTRSKLVQQSSTVFNELWEKYGITPVRNDAGTEVTPSYTSERLRSRLEANAEELEEKGIEGPVFKGFVRKALANAHEQIEDMSEEEMEERQEKVDEMKQGNVVDASVAEDSTPLVYDPEVIDILKASAPFAYDSLAREGQEGFEAVYNTITAREDPVGMVSESDAINLQDLANDFTMTKNKDRMRIYADQATVSDFTATASEHYMDLNELAVGARLSEHALFHEKEVFYGLYYDGDDHGSALEDDYPTNCQQGPNAFDGLAYKFANAGQVVDKTGTSSGFVEDIKSELTGLLQGDYAVNPNDLEIWTSHDMYDTLENILVDSARIDMSGNVDYGNYTLNIKGVPVYATHNIDQETVQSTNDDTAGDSLYDQLISASWVKDDVTGTLDHTIFGDNGDVFIVDTRTARFRELAPLTTFPLGRRGASDEVAMVEYGALIEKSGGYFGRFLRGYDI